MVGGRGESRGMILAKPDSGLVGTESDLIGSFFYWKVFPEYLKEIKEILRRDLICPEDS